MLFPSNPATQFFPESSLLLCAPQLLWDFFLDSKEVNTSWKLTSAHSSEHFWWNNLVLAAPWQERDEHNSQSIKKETEAQRAQSLGLNMDPGSLVLICKTLVRKQANRFVIQGVLTWEILCLSTPFSQRITEEPSGLLSIRGYRGFWSDWDEGEEHKTQVKQTTWGEDAPHQFRHLDE